MQNQKNRSWVEPTDFKPVKIVDVEISSEIPVISSLDGNGQEIYQGAMILARLHSYPLGLINLNFRSEEIPAEELAGCIWDQFGGTINEHLRDDGLPKAEGLTAAGLATGDQVKCLEERQEVLRDAPMASIVLSTRDRVQSLSATLYSILALEYPNFEVVLVDNAPQTNETFEFFNFIQPRFLREGIGFHYVREDTPGLAVAHNHGLEAVNGAITAFTDDDVIVDKNWLAEIVRGFTVAPNVGGVTGLVVPLELDTPAQVLFEEFGGFTKGFVQQIYDLDEYRPDNVLFPYAAGRFGTGANMAFRTDFLRRTGGFDPALGIGTPALGADDMAAFFKTIIHGYQLVYQPSAMIHHQHRRTFESLCKQMFGYGTGLTAFLTKCVLDYPGLIVDFVSRIPTGIRYAFSRNSDKNRRKTSSYPRELDRIERKGMLYGPIAYLRSRWKYRHAKREIIAANSIPEATPVPAYLVTGLMEDYQGEKRTKEI